MRRVQALDAAAAKLASAVFQEVSQGRGAGAIVRARELAMSRPLAADAHHAVALCAAQAGLFEEALQAFDRALELAPGQPSILANRARFLGRHGDAELAARAWRGYLDAYPQDAVAWQELGLQKLACARSMGRHAAQPGADDRLRTEAIGSLQRALRLNPRLVRAWHGLAGALRDQHELAEAEASLRQALALEPSSAVLWASLAGVLRLRGRAREALECYQRARALGELDPEILDAEVGSLVDCLEIAHARTAVHDLITRHPGFAPAYSTLANLEWEYGGAEGTTPEQRYRDAADRQPGNVELQLGYINFLLQIKQGEEAFERLQRLRRLKDDPRLLALQADALELCGDSEQAGRCYAEADRSLGDRDVRFINAYVRHLLRTGQPSVAAARATSALGLEPTNQESLAYLATAWRLLGDPREEWLCGFDRLVAMVPVDVPEGWRDQAAFLTDLRGALEPLHQARRQPVAQSVRGGSQTPGRLFGRSDPCIQALQGALESTIERWLTGLPKAAGHPFLSRAARTIHFTGSWSVKLWGAGRHANHFHSEGWMSSAFYVALPDSVSSAADSAEDKTPGALQLGQPPTELGLMLEPRRILRPRLGHVALFPSYLWHGTVPFQDSEPRITVAFDMLPKH